MSATIAQNKENKPEPPAYEKVMKQLKAANRPWSLSTLNKNNKNHSGGKRTKASDQHQEETQEETQEEPQQETQEDITYESLETFDEAHSAAISEYKNLTKALNQYGRTNPYLNGSMPTNLFKKKSQESSGKESASAGESKEQVDLTQQIKTLKREKQLLQNKLNKIPRDVRFFAQCIGETSSKSHSELVKLVEQLRQGIFNITTPVHTNPHKTKQCAECGRPANGNTQKVCAHVDCQAIFPINK